MRSKYRLSAGRAEVCLPVLLILGMFLPADASREVGFPEDGKADLLAIDFQFGGLKPEEEYEVYFDGYFQGIVISDPFGRARLPIPGSVRQIEIREHIRAESEVGNWTRYE